MRCERRLSLADWRDRLKFLSMKRLAIKNVSDARKHARLVIPWLNISALNDSGVVIRSQGRYNRAEPTWGKIYLFFFLRNTDRKRNLRASSS